MSRSIDGSRSCAGARRRDAISMLRPLAPLAGLLLMLAGATGSVRAADWPQFRGPASNSAVAENEGPADWDLAKMTAWKVELPGSGPSSPIVVGRRVLVTASSGISQDRLHVLCFDAGDGRRLWERQFWATGRTITHPQSANAAPTPASDGQAVFAFFSSNDLVALDLEGNLLWYRGLGRDYPRIGNDAGMASSPVVLNGLVIAQTESQGARSPSPSTPATERLAGATTATRCRAGRRRSPSTKASQAHRPCWCNRSIAWTASIRRAASRSGAIRRLATESRRPARPADSFFSRRKALQPCDRRRAIQNPRSCGNRINSSRALPARSRPRANCI